MKLGLDDGIGSRGFLGFAVENRYEKRETRNFLYTATTLFRLGGGVSTIIFIGSGQQDWMSSNLGVGGRSQETKVGRD